MAQRRADLAGGGTVWWREADRYGHAQVWRGWLHADGRRRPVVVKPVDRTGFEQRFHTALAAPGLRELRERIAVVPFAGTAVAADGRRLIVLERADCSLRDVAAADPTRHGPLVRRVAALAAADAFDTLRRLREADGDDLLPFVAHRDIGPDNLLLAAVGPGRRVQLADFGSAQLDVVNRSPTSTVALAPEQWGASPAGASFGTDLWGLAVAVWEVLHGGALPYRDEHGHPLRGGGEVVVQEGQRVATDCGCALADVPAHAFAVALLAATTPAARVAAATALRPDLELEAEAMRHDPRDEAGALLAAAGLGERPAEARVPVRRARLARLRSRIRARIPARGAVLAAVALVVLGTAVGAAVAVAALAQFTALPDPDAALRQRAVVAGGVGLVGALLLLVLRRRLPRGWVAAAVVAAGTASGIALAVLPADWSVAAVAGSAAVAGPAIAALTARRRRPGRRAVPVLAAGLAVVLVAGGGAALADPVRDQAAAVTVAQRIAGVPDGVPAFYDPTDVAVNAAGDVAVLESHGTHHDDVWVLPGDGGTPFLAVASDGWWRLAASDAFGGSVSAPTFFSAVAWSGSRLVLLGDTGVFMAAATPDATPHRLSAAIGTNGSDEDRIDVAGGAILVHGEGLQVRGAAKTPTCGGGTAVPTTWTLPFDGTRVTGGPTAATAAGGCAPRVVAVGVLDGSLHYLAVQPKGTGTRLGLMWGAFGGTPKRIATVPASWADADIRVAAGGGRLVIASSGCLYGTVLGAGVTLPHVISADAWYGSGPDVTRCSAIPSLDLEPDVIDSSADATNPSVSADCRPAGRPALLLVGRQRTPLTATPDGTLYLFDTPSDGCSVGLWRLAPKDTLWSSAATDQLWHGSWLAADWKRGTTPIMSADHPDTQGGAISWSGGSYRAEVSTSAAGVDLSADAEIPAVWQSGPLRLTIRYRGDSDTTELAVATTADDGSALHYRVAIDGLSDAEVASDGSVVLAGCGQVLSIDPRKAWFRRQADGAVVSGADMPMTVLAGATDVVAQGCAARATAPDVLTGTVGAGIDPTAVAVAPACAGCRQEIVFTETDRIAGHAVSRIRILEPQADSGNGRLTTVGATLDSTAPAEGDLAPLGLVATDVAIAADGRIAVSTASASGVGPVIVIDHGRRIVPDLAGRRISGVAWQGDRLVVTDALSGDLLVLDLPRS